MELKRKKGIGVFGKFFVTLLLVFILPVVVFYPLASNYLIAEINNSYSKIVEMKMDDYHNNFADTLDKLGQISILIALDENMNPEKYTSNIIDTRDAMLCLNRYIANLDMIENAFVVTKDSDYIFSPYTTYTPERFYNAAMLTEQKHSIEEYLQATTLFPKFLKSITYNDKNVIPVMYSVNTDFWKKDSILVFMLNCDYIFNSSDFMVHISAEDTYFSSVDKDTMLEGNNAPDDKFIRKVYKPSYNCDIELFYDYNDFWQTTHSITKTLYLVLIAILVVGLALTYILAKLNYLPMKAIKALIPKETKEDGAKKSGNEYVAITEYITTLQGRYDEFCLREHENSPLLLEYYTRQLLTNSITYPTHMKEAYKKAGLNLDRKLYSCVSLRFSRNMRDATIVEHNNSIKKQALDLGLAVYSYREATYVYMLFGYDDNIGFKNFIKILTNYLNSNDCGVAAIGNETDDDTQIYKSHTQSKNAMDYRFAALNSRIIYYANIEKVDTKSFQYPNQLINKILSCIMHPDNLKLAMNELNDFINKNQVNFSTVRLIYQEVVNSALKTAYTQTGSLSEELYTYSIELLHMESIDSLTNLLYEFFSACQKIIGTEKTFSSKVRRYIEEHLLDSNLSVQAIAWELNITPQHLSSNFKKETGIRVIDFITKKRIDYICNMLITTKDSIRSIITAAGYADTSSFSKKFKQIIGMTPGEYRRLNS